MTPVWHFVDGVLIGGPVPFSFGSVLTIGTTAVTSTVPILAPDGTAAAPSYSIASAPTNGMYWDGNALNFSRGGTREMYIATGLVDIVTALAFGTGQDVALSRGAANRLDLASGDSFRAVLGTVDYANANGQLFSAVQQLTELTTIAAAATTDTTIQMPANAVVLGVSVRVTTVIPTAATFTVGDSGSAARFSTAAVSTAANSTDPGTKAGAYYNASALAIRITPDAQPADNTGRVRVTIYYFSVTPPTS